MGSKTEQIALSIVPLTIVVSSLLPLLQNQTVKLRIGDELKLLCAGRFAAVRWSFTPRNSDKTVILDNTSNEIRYGNLSSDKDGFYRCSTSTDSQVSVFLFILRKL